MPAELPRPAVEPAWRDARPSLPHSALDMRLVVARAYLANELDNHLGISGYALRQQVMDCASRAELEGLFDSIEKDLTDAFYIDAIDIIHHAQSVLNR